MKAIVVATAMIGTLALAPAALASDCPDQAPMENPFLEWGDAGDYFLAPGGDFEDGGSWALGRGATLLAGLSPDGWGTSLAIPPRGSVTSPPICVAAGYTHGRMFGATAGGDRTRVRVQVLYGRDSDSSELRLGRGWDATRKFTLDEEEFALDPATGTGKVRLRLGVVGDRTAVLDRVYIDPRARH